jgi:EmrB/QacA subfamily drug resistance transporter
MIMNDDMVQERRRNVALFAVLLGQFMLVLDATVVNVALPSIQGDFHLTASTLTWVNSAYLIAFGGLLLLFGRLGDLFGRRRIFLTGLTLFTVASIACGLAPDASLLVIARFIQGIGASAASSVVLAIIATEFPEAGARARAMSGYMFVSVAGGSLGLFVGGFLTEALSWHWVFLINLPFGLVALRLAATNLRESAPRGDKGVDILGAVLVTGAAMAAIYGLVEAAHAPWTSVGVAGPLALAVLLLVALVQVERTVERPLMPPRVLRIRSLIVTSIVRSFLAMGLFGVFFLATLDLSQALHFGPFEVGLAFLPQTLVVAALSLGTSAKLVRRFGPVRVLMAGLSLAALGLAIFASLAIDEPYLPMRMIAHVLMGLGFGSSFLPLLTLAMSEVPPEDAGIGSAIVNLSLQLSAAIAVTILVSAASYRTGVLAKTGTPIAEAVIHGYRFAEGLAAAAVLTGVAITATFLRQRSPRATIAVPVATAE